MEQHSHNIDNEQSSSHCCGRRCSYMYHKETRRMIGVTLLFLSLFLLANIVTEVKGWRYVGSGVIATNTISVQGEGEVFAVPDTGVFTFSVIQEGATAEVVQADAAKIANKVIEYLKENGVEEKDIKTTSYNVFPRYEQKRIVCITFPCPVGERELIGFEINQSIQVKVRDTAKVGELLSGVGNFGVQRISGVSFTIDDEDALQREARQMAVADAKQKAQTLADDLGVRLVRVVNFNEFGSPVYARFEAQALSFDQAAASVPNIPTGENRITSQVNITYEIR